MMSPSSVHTGRFAAGGPSEDERAREQARRLREQVLGQRHEDDQGDRTPNRFNVSSRSIQPGQLLSPTGTMAQLPRGQGEHELKAPPPPPPRGQPPSQQAAPSAQGTPASTFTADTLAGGPPLSLKDAASPADAAMAQGAGKRAASPVGERAGLAIVPAMDSGEQQVERHDASTSITMRPGARPADPLDAAGQAASDAAKAHRQAVLRGIRRLKDTLIEAAD